MGGLSSESPVVVVISVDPRTSHRANEAMRIGLGVVAGENDVVFVLRGPAVHLLDEDTDDLVDGDDIAKFRANLRSLAVPFHVEADDVPDGPGWNVEQHPIVRVTTDETARMIARARRVMVF